MQNTNKSRQAQVGLYTTTRKKFGSRSAEFGVGCTTIPGRPVSTVKNKTCGGFGFDLETENQENWGTPGNPCTWRVLRSVSLTIYLETLRKVIPEGFHLGAFFYVLNCCKYGMTSYYVVLVFFRFNFQYTSY